MIYSYSSLFYSFYCFFHLFSVGFSSPVWNWCPIKALVWMRMFDGSNTFWTWWGSEEIDLLHQVTDRQQELYYKLTRWETVSWLLWHSSCFFQESDNNSYFLYFWNLLKKIISNKQFIPLRASCFKNNKKMNYITQILIFLILRRLIIRFYTIWKMSIISSVI